MKKLINIFSLIVTLLTCYSCSDPYKDTAFQVYDINPASSYMESREDLSEWVHVLRYADLYNAINYASASFTVFAPTNDAMKKFYEDKGVKSIEELGVEYAKDMIECHVVSDSINYATFMQGGDLEKKTLSDETISVTFGSGEGGETGINAIYLNGYAHVNEMAIRVSNGFIYTLDNAMEPVTESVYDRLQDDDVKDQFSIMIEALDATGWKDSLDVIEDTIKGDYGAQTIIKRSYTLLGVTNDVFAQAGINSLADLSAKVGSEDNNYKDKNNELNRYVAYHIMRGNYPLSRLEFASTDTVGTYTTRGTSADGTIIMFSKEDDRKTYLNYDNESGRATVIDLGSNIKARNGVIHKLSSWLPIYEPKPATVYFDFCDFSEVENYIGSYGTEGQKYQTSTQSNEYRTDISKVTCYNVDIQNPASYASYNALDYFTVKESSNWVKCLNRDQMIINVGYTGSVSMKTPTLIKGKYKVTLVFCYATSMNFMRQTQNGSNGGLMRFAFDGMNAKELAPYTTVPSNTLGIYETELYDELYFDGTQSHNLKITVLDPAASTQDKFRIQLDYLKFEPIDK